MTNGARDPANRPASDAAKSCQAPEEVLWTEGQSRAAGPAAAGPAAAPSPRAREAHVPHRNSVRLLREAMTQDASRRPLSVARSNPLQPQPPVADFDVAEERPAGEHDPRGPGYPRAGLQVGPAHLRAGLHLDLDALGNQQVDVTEQCAGVNVGLALADLRPA